MTHAIAVLRNVVLMTLLAWPGAALAASIDECLLAELEAADDGVTVGELRARCEGAASASPIQRDAVAVKPGAVTQRILTDRALERAESGITPHRMNYLLPFSKTTGINRAPYAGVVDFADEIVDTELKFQMSFKFPLGVKSVLLANDGFYFGLTTTAWWQLYAADISAPFRETNYRPELFYLAPLDLRVAGGDIGLMVGIEHESNGRGGSLSRSWNRTFAQVLLERDGFATSIRLWDRWDEGAKPFPGAAEGDDNPDIVDFTGHFEWQLAYEWNDRFEISARLRRNLATSNGAFQLDLTFPLFGKVKGYLQYFDGYGESLIDYDFRQRRVGLGFAVSDLL